MHPAIVELQERNLIAQSTDINTLSKLLYEGKAVYCGFDPTADSLHVGSLLPLTVLKIFRTHKIPVIAVVGGATGRIGDPSFKAQERNVLSSDVIQHNLDGITEAIKSVLGDDDNVHIIDNFDWAREMNVIDFMRLYGKCFTVNNMINKESVKSRIERPDQGISFAEFSYPIIQGMDFHYLYQVLDCAIQIGGSDQWGNMIAGTDIIHKLHPGSEVGVITLPLLTKDDGTKFGKTESGTVWLSKEKTTAFEMFQFWQNLSDSEARRMFEIFQPLEGGVETFDTKMEHNPVKTKQMFATGMVELIHGALCASQVMAISNALFGTGSDLDQEELEMLIGTFEVHNWHNNLVETLVLSNLASSRKMAREFIANNAVKANTTVIDADFVPMEGLTLLRRGKNKFVLIKKE